MSESPDSTGVDVATAATYCRQVLVVVDALGCPTRQVRSDHVFGSLTVPACRPLVKRIVQRHLTPNLRAAASDERLRSLAEGTSTSPADELAVVAESVGRPRRNCSR